MYLNGMTICVNLGYT